MFSTKFKLLLFSIFFLTSISYAQSHLERAVALGWVIERPIGNKETRFVFTGKPFSLIQSVVSGIDPGNIRHGVVMSIKNQKIMYKSDGKTADFIETDIYEYTDNVIKQLHISPRDDMETTFCDTYDQHNRIIKTEQSNNYNATIIKYNYVYDELLQMLFIYKNDKLDTVWTEYCSVDRIVYNKYRNKAKYETHIIQIDLIGDITQIEKTTFLPHEQVISLSTFEYTNGRITHFIQYSKSINKNVYDIKYFYDNERYIKEFDFLSNYTTEYSDFDSFNNWRTMVCKNPAGKLYTVIKREIKYADDENK